MKVMFVGDIHAQFGNFVQDCLDTYDVYPYEAIVQVGDFGIWNDIRYSPKRKNVTKNSIKPYEYIFRHLPKVPVYFCGGNHENWDVLDKFTEKTRITEKSEIYFMPLGETLHLGDSNLLFLGGGDSHDKQWRMNYQKNHKEKIWWENEGISEEDLKNSLDKVEKADIIISHERPASVTKNLLEGCDSHELFKYHHEHRIDLQETTKNLDFVLEQKERLGIKTWIYGHWHEPLNRWCQDGVEFMGLDMIPQRNTEMLYYNGVTLGTEPNVTSLNYTTLYDGYWKLILEI